MSSISASTQVIVKQESPQKLSLAEFSNLGSLDDLRELLGFLRSRKGSLTADELNSDLSEDVEESILIHVLKAECENDNQEAVESIKFEIVNYLLNEMNVDPNICDLRGTSPLMLAVQSGNEDITEALMRRRADVNLENIDGFTALIILVVLENNRLLSLFLDLNLSFDLGLDFEHVNNKGQSVLKLAMNCRNLDILRELLSISWNLDFIFEGDDFSPLMQAVAQRDLEIVELFLGMNADVDFENDDELTAADLAEGFARQDRDDDVAMAILELLLDARNNQDQIEFEQGNEYLDLENIIPVANVEERRSPPSERKG